MSVGLFTVIAEGCLKIGIAIEVVHWIEFRCTLTAFLAAKCGPVTGRAGEIIAICGFQIRIGVEVIGWVKSRAGATTFIATIISPVIEQCFRIISESLFEVGISIGIPAWRDAVGFLREPPPKQSPGRARLQAA